MNNKLKDQLETAKEEGRREGFKWGVNYLAILIENSTLISELYGWKQIVDMSVERAHKLTEKEIPHNMRIEATFKNE